MLLFYTISNTISHSFTSTLTIVLQMLPFCLICTKYIYSTVKHPGLPLLYERCYTNNVLSLLLLFLSQCLNSLSNPPFFSDKHYFLYIYALFPIYIYIGGPTNTWDHDFHTSPAPPLDSRQRR